jgi:hypothetical protein
LLEQKKARSVCGLESIFFEENRGDRQHDAFIAHIRPIYCSDTGYLFGE